jgi:NADH-quinone oxidoreductase subunit M
MVNHGITTGALFVLLGLLEERTGTNDIHAYGGLWGKVPWLSGFLLLFSLATVGLPGLNNFVGEFLVVAGVFRVYPWAAVTAFFGIILVLAYMLRMVQRVIFEKEGPASAIPDISPREGLMLAACSILIVLLGVYPVPLLDLIEMPIALLTGGTGGLP